LGEIGNEVVSANGEKEFEMGTPGRERDRIGHRQVAQLLGTALTPARLFSARSTVAVDSPAVSAISDKVAFIVGTL
jgi:hypothetical protein